MELNSIESNQRVSSIQLNFNSQYPSGIGVTYDGQIPMQIFLGVKDLITNNVVNDMQTLDIIRAYYHEIRHADHKATKFEVCDNHRSDMKIDFIACDKNSTVTGMRYNMDPVDDYWNNIRELDCEYYAFERMYELLQNKNIFPGIEDSEDLMVRYMNTKLFDVVNDIPFSKSNTF